ncbi:trans-sialidase, putative [Trypanosoma cruzi marinkellei]|uniref:Trans-sialidase, putative n=1 Tax=Trypanosoma cruzi marinkellei TaxID=85056 RepID=K2MNZ0_TRYCR|nr:trans-sialidase, putative [Trypanosoma cruzi marinkellei]
MLSRVEAVKAPRTYNRRRVTGSSGRRREGRKSERQRPNMSRHHFYSAVLLLLVVMMCCGSGGAHAVQSNSKDTQMPQWADIFVSGKTLVLAKDGSEAGVKDSFGAPSLVSAGGVMAVITNGFFKRGSIFLRQSDIIAGYLNPAWDWSSLVAEVSKATWRAYTVFHAANETELVGSAQYPTTIAKENKVFLLMGTSEKKYASATKNWTTENRDIKLIVGEPKPSKERGRSGTISWGDPKSILKPITPKTQDELNFVPSGGAGVLMKNGTLVFLLGATNETQHRFTRITYSTDDGDTWEFPEGTLPTDCLAFSNTEWDEGQILLIAECVDGRRVYESRDMGRAWTEAVGILPGFWVYRRSGARWEIDFSVGSIITATIEEVKLMLYVHKRYISAEKKEKGLYLWVTDNKRMFHFGPLFVDSVLSESISYTLLYSDGALQLARYTYTIPMNFVSLARLTEELETIKSTLRTWKRLDASFYESSTPTDGLVGLLSNAASGDTWFDDYRCVNAKVTKATKVHNGFKFTEPGSKAVWPVNSWEDNNYYGFVNNEFTLVATVSIHQVPSESTPLLGASLGDTGGKKFIGLSYDEKGRWETVFNGAKAAQESSWKPGEEYQVALTLTDGKKGSVYVNGVVGGSSEPLPTPETRGGEISYFYIGGDEGGSGGALVVRNVFLYNRPLSVDELKMVTKKDGSVRAGVSRVLLLLLLGLWGLAALY